MWGLCVGVPGQDQHSPHVDRLAGTAASPQAKPVGELGVSNLERGAASPLALSLRRMGRSIAVKEAGPQWLAIACSGAGEQVDRNPRFPGARGEVLSRALEGD